MLKQKEYNSNDGQTAAITQGGSPVSGAAAAAGGPQQFPPQTSATLGNS